ncbi:MAG: type II secretion system F family protein [Nanoarchaeota archaeon]|nr:type II secretion system F family protein [Nanoarchaeota archaeon]
MKLEKKYLILLISALASVLILIGSLLLLEMTIVTIAYLAVIVISILLFPFTLYEYVSKLRVKMMEEQFPTFLKDLADSLRAGVTVADAIKTASKSDYRELNPEIQRMSNQMSWGVSFETVINEQMERLKESVYISRGLAILLQSFKSGGDISPIMTSVADSTILLQNVQKDQESSMTEQTSIIYVIQFVFVIITVVLFRVLIPITNTGGFGEALLGGVGGGQLDMDYYKGFFFVTIVIQSICNGLVAGVTQSGSLLSGVKHVALMFSVSLIIFTIFILPKTLTISAVSERYALVKGQDFRIFGTVNYDDDFLINQRVEVVLENETYVGFTDESGDYDIAVTAPDDRGSYDGLVRVEYEDKVAEAVFSFNVR